MKKVEQHRKEHCNFSKEKNEQFKYGQKPVVIDAPIQEKKTWIDWIKQGDKTRKKETARKNWRRTVVE